jgi:hypothetical protein
MQWQGSVNNTYAAAGSVRVTIMGGILQRTKTACTIAAKDCACSAQQGTEISFWEKIGWRTFAQPFELASVKPLP